MISKTNIDVETARLIYKKYKLHIIYSSIILISLFVFMVYTLPRILEFSSQGAQREEERQRLSVMNDNLAILTKTNEASLDSKLEAVITALPASSDFEGIINALTLASAKSGASVADYSFESAGSGSSASVEGYPTTQLQLSISSSEEQFLDFLKYLSELTPLSEVTEINKNGSSISLILVFYFKPTLADQITDGIKLHTLSAKEEALIGTITSWKTPDFTTSIEEIASDSASIF